MTALLHDYGGALLRAVAIHTGYVLTAVLIGFVLGLALGILLSRVHRWAVIVMPLLSIFQTIPGLVFIGVLFIWWGGSVLTVVDRKSTRLNSSH